MDGPRSGAPEMQSGAAIVTPNRLRGFGPSWNSVIFNVALLFAFQMEGPDSGARKLHLDLL